MNVSKAAALLAVGAGVTALVGPAGPAAAITCQGPNQLVSGTVISTPYCEDEYIALVARTAYGLRVTGDQVRNYPSVKEEVCRAIGHDTRVAHYCSGGGPFEMTPTMATPPGGGGGQQGGEER